MRIHFTQRALKFALVSAFAVGSAGFGFNSYATGTDTATFAVTATVVTSCTISATALAFGNEVNVRTAVADGSSTINATCTPGGSYSIGLNEGLGGGTVTSRKMTHANGTNKLDYNLSTIASGGINWDNINGTTVATGTGTGSAQPLTVYGRIPIQPSAIPGAYSDTITATISF